MRVVYGLLALVALFGAGASAQTAEQPQQLGAEAFTRRPAIWSAAISPDGRSVAAIQESSRGPVLTIIDWRTRTAQITQLARRDQNLTIDWVVWKNDNRLIFALRQEAQDEDDIETSRVFAVNRDGTNLTLMFGGEMRRRVRGYAPVVLMDIQRNDPESVLLATYAQHGYTVYRANVTTGRASEIVDYAEWDTVIMYVDGAGYPVMRVDELTDGSGWHIFRRGPGQRDWTLAVEFRRGATGQNRVFQPLGAGPGPGQVFVAARAENQEFQSIYLYNTATGELGAPIYSHDGADASVAWLDEARHSVVVGCGEARRWECRAQEPGMQQHLDGLNRHFEGEVDISLRSMSADKRYWLISAHGPRSPETYYVYDSAEASVSFLASSQPHLMPDQLARSRVVEYQASDGMALWGYLTEPTGAGPHPMVVMPHGGPESRDSYDYSFFVQFLVSRGYAVFQPNFRGSEGSGRSFALAGRHQWGRRMQDDISDGVRHLIGAGVADAQRICIVGASYGGYAALVGATLTPDLYQCAISIAGVSDLTSMLGTERREGGRGSYGYAYWVSLIGDPVVDRDQLIATSPARQVQNVRIPVLLMHGEEDWVVPVEQSERMQRALQEAGREVEFIRFEDEGHFWGAWEVENRTRMLQETERFLAQHLRR